MRTPDSPFRRRWSWLAALAALTAVSLGYSAESDKKAAPAEPNSPPKVELAFTVAGDMRQYVNGTPTKRYFDGACEAMKAVGAGAFLVTPGDLDPPAPVRAALDRTMGPAFPWYVVVGNHEVETSEDVKWIKAWAAAGIPNLVRPGPTGAEHSMYSFEYANSHFVVIDTYPEAKDGNKGPVDMTEAWFAWLEADLAANQKPLVWVVGHQPIEVQPDMDTGRMRHHRESVSKDASRRDRFVALLLKHKVRAYICGHTHNASVVRLAGGLWQLDSGHARGAGDTGSPSTFLKVRIADEQAWVDVYRAADPATATEYKRTVTFELAK